MLVTVLIAFGSFVLGAVGVGLADQHCESQRAMPHSIQAHDEVGSD